LTNFTRHYTNSLQGQHLARPPKPIGYERELARAKQAHQQANFVEESNSATATMLHTRTPPRYISPILRAQAPEFTPSTPTLQLPTRVTPVTPCTRVRDSNSSVDSSGKGSDAEYTEKKVQWAENGDMISSRPRTIPERLCALIGRNWEPLQAPVGPIKRSPTKDVAPNLAAIPRSFESPRKK
jgi:hypothetical protein